MNYCLSFIFVFVAAFNLSALSSESYIREGMASWYGRQHHEKLTSSGEMFNMNHYTAAHRKLPFGTKVRVQNLRNGRSTIVTINDRGPFSGKRIIDLSRAAAREIGLLKKGVERVRIEVILN